MFLKCNSRFKNGKDHRYWSIVENKRSTEGKVMQRALLYLGEINDSQREAWCRTIRAFDTSQSQFVELALFPSDRLIPSHVAQGIQVCLSQFELRRARQWGACWLACWLWERLELDDFWKERLAPSREGTHWKHILQTLVCYRLIEPGSEWRLHRHWFERSAMGDLLQEDFALVQKDNLYRCLDKLLDHKAALFQQLRRRWEDLFGVKFQVLLYDLTSTYFESDPPFGETDKRQFGYSRDKRSDCVQVVVALVVSPEGFPLAYEVMSGNTSDRTTLKEFLSKIETLYGKADRIWVMDRGIPTEEVLEQMRKSDPPISYLVGTPKGRLSKLEKALATVPWQQVHESVSVKLLPQKEEFYVFVQSEDRIQKERAIRRKRLKKLWARLKKLRGMKLTRDELLLKLGAAQKEAGRAYGLVEIRLPAEAKPVSAETFQYQLRKKKLRVVRRREGRYLLRAHRCGTDPGALWGFYMQLTEVEAAFKNLKGDLAIRPIFHRLENRIEAHIFVCFLAYCLHVTLRHRLRAMAPGLTPKAVLEKMAAIQMVDVHFPTTDGRTLIFSRYTQPEKDQKMLLAQLDLKLPPQPPPRITTGGKLTGN
jgi:transposase